SKDGTEVSMFLIYPKGIELDGSTPFLLTGYGGFNISLKPRFSTRNVTWTEMGGGIAIPNLRGGGEYGQEWHEAGMRENKQNVFDDFIAAAEYLESQGYSNRDRLAISGGSNGGLLVSAAVTQRPELFSAVLCSVPLTDMMRYHKFGLANIWSEEYGNAEDPTQAQYLLRYSPYHNVTKGTDYPAILVTGSANDARTAPVHAQKMAAAIRWADQDHGQKQPILLSINADSGHGGGVGIDTVADQTARQYGFLAAQIGLTPPTTE
ncbi:MAG: prolyl oligopeptidase family serine peptidase, partial [Myxococcota bacterium]|nr:prolyl oligopeptidase family serine peptidase [Myxococcota bacterium]